VAYGRAKSMTVKRVLVLAKERMRKRPNNFVKMARLRKRNAQTVPEWYE
jgi:hypothetical protein